MTARSPSSRADLIGGVGAAAIVLAPYLTTGFAFRTALHVQAAILAALTLGLVLAGAVQPGWRSRLRSSSPRLVVAGLSLYAAAALGGAVVGLLRGNTAPALAGQALSMGLLPLAAIAGLGLAGRGWVRSFASGLGAAVAVASVAHLVAWALTGGGGDAFARRLFFANAVSVVGSALLGLLCLLSLLATGGRLVRIVAGLTGCCVCLFIVGTGVRGLWLVTPLAAAVFGLLALTPRRALRAGAALAIVGAVGIVAAAGLERWLERPRTNLMNLGVPFELPTTAASSAPAAATAGAVNLQAAGDHRFAIVEPSLPIAPAVGSAYRLRAVLAGPPEGFGFVVLRWLDGGGRAVGRVSVRTAGGAGATAERWLSVPAGTASVRVVVGCSARPPGTWKLLDLRLERIGPGVLLPLLREHAYLEARLASIALLGGGDGFAADRSLDLRRRETERLLYLFGQAGWPARIFGHGLGARFAFAAWSRDAAARPVADPQPNYIHNFYAFLLFKLGLLGGAMVVAALAAWVTAALLAVRGRDPGFARAFAAVAAAGLAAYAIWSVASPEILDFRVAPLWGLLLAGLARTSAPGTA